jgi:hypothetical protein
MVVNDAEKVHGSATIATEEVRQDTKETAAGGVG